MALYDFIIAIHGTSCDEVLISDDEEEHVLDQVCTGKYIGIYTF